MSLCDLHRRAWDGAAKERLFGSPDESISDVQAYAQDVERRTGGTLRDQDRLERWTQHRHLFLRSSPQDLPVRGMQDSLVTKSGDRINLCGPARRDIGGGGCDCAEQGAHPYNRHWIAGAYAKQHTAQ